jgi:hypothetical protein
MQTVDLTLEIVRLLMVGIGAMSAGLGIFIAGAKMGRMVDRLGGRIPAALESQAQAQAKMAEIGLRHAAALEQTAQVIPLIQQMQDERREIGITLRAMSRKLNEVLKEYGEETESEQ